MECSRKKLLKFTNPSNYSLMNLEQGVIYCQHFSKYNDPFEFWSPIYEGIPCPEEEPERFSAALKAWGMEGCDPNDVDLISYFDECKDYQPPFKKMRDFARIACFSSQKDNMLMWSHYADGLRGFCIVFDEEVILESEPEAYILDVEYKKNPPTIDSFVYAISYDQDWYNSVAIEETQARIKALGNAEDDKWISIYEEYGALAVAQMHEIWQKVFAVKPREWKYENERRLIVHTSMDDEEPLLYSYPPHAVKEIILGERMDESYRIKIMSILREKYPAVAVKKARRVLGKYSVIIESVVA